MISSSPQALFHVITSPFKDDCELPHYGVCRLSQHSCIIPAGSISLWILSLPVCSLTQSSVTRGRSFSQWPILSLESSPREDSASDIALSIILEASGHVSDNSWAMTSISSYKYPVKTLDTHLKRRKLETTPTSAVSETYSSMT